VLFSDALAGRKAARCQSGSMTTRDMLVLESHLQQWRVDRQVAAHKHQLARLHSQSLSKTTSISWAEQSTGRWQRVEPRGRRDNKAVKPGHVVPEPDESLAGRREHESITITCMQPTTATGGHLLG
jgi:hypothetical protein